MAAKITWYKGPPNEPGAHAYRLVGNLGKWLTGEQVRLCRYIHVDEFDVNEPGGENDPLDVVWADMDVLVDGPCRNVSAL